MSEPIMNGIFAVYQRTHDRLLNLALGLTDEQIVWRPNPTTPSIGFHLWHIARWADYLQEMINGAGSQVWEQEGLAAAWGLETERLGYAATGMGMDEEGSMALTLPGKDVLLDYVSRVLATAQQAVSTISDEQFYTVYEDRYGTTWNEGRIGLIITSWMTHDNRHLGMIECLLGVQGVCGSAAG